MFEKSRLIRALPKAFIPAFGIFLAYPLSVIISSVLPDLNYQVFIVDVFGFTPSFIVMTIALYFYLQGGPKARQPKIFKIGLFMIAIAVSIFLTNDVYTGSGLNFDQPMKHLMILFSAWNAFYSIMDHEKQSSLIILISKENSLRAILTVVYSLIGFPLLLIDVFSVFGFFGMGVVGGAGLRDGLNVMLMTLSLYSLLIYGTNMVVNRIIKYPDRSLGESRSLEYFLETIDKRKKSSSF